MELLERYPLEPGVEILPSDYLWPPAITAALDDSPSTSRTPPRSPALTNRMAVRVNTRITDPEWFQEVRHIEFDSETKLELGVV
jgi:hypothetical protein